MILGAVCLALGKSRPKISPEVSSLLMETGLENLNSLLEELGLKSRGMYLPSSITGGKPRAVIPLRSNPQFPEISQPLARRLIVSYGQGPEDIGIMVTTPGSNIINMLEMKPGPSSDEMATALTTLLVGTLDVASGVKVSRAGNKISVKISHPCLKNDENSWAVRSLGSPIASVVASLLAETLDKPILVKKEGQHRADSFIELEILNHLHEEQNVK